jgi:hypothetical protein
LAVGTGYVAAVSLRWHEATNMKALIPLVLLALASASLGQESKAAASLAWANVASGYHHFDDIKPMLVNDGNVSIFLSRLWPDGSAQLERFNQDTGDWEAGEWGIRCGAVDQPTVPIEIKPHSRQEIQVYWQLSTDKWQKPKRFVLNHSLESRPLEGKYRFVLRYAEQPWTLVHHPSAVYNFRSPEFVLLP